MLQGQGGGTLDKERRIGSAESIGMTIANGLANRSGWRQKLPYFHLDLNAGSGWNEIAGCPGSPVVFLELAQQQLTAMPLYAWFCDINGAAIDKLERWLLRYGHLPQPGISLLCEDNRTAIQRFAEQIRRRDRPEYALGSLLCDPNAWFYRAKDGNGVPVKEVIEFAHEFPKIDIIFNGNYRFYAQARGAQEKLGQSFAGLLSPEQICARLNRRHWLVSRQVLGGPNRFWLAIGRNVPTGDHRKLGLVHRDSAEGRAIMSIVSGDRQGELEMVERSCPVPALPLFPHDAEAAA
jgi:hypothetical protein